MRRASVHACHAGSPAGMPRERMTSPKNAGTNPGMASLEACST
jgi:hypothetical protein